MRPLVYKFDATVIEAVQKLPHWLHWPMVIITNAGQPAVMIMAALIYTGIALAQHDTRLLLASITVPFIVGVSAVLKMILQRARPATEYAQKMFIHTFSFPSGHAAAIMIGAGFLAYMSWQSLAAPWAGLAVIGLVLSIGLVGLSRVYLGAHYPSDVVGGWLLGILGIGMVLVIKPTLHL